MGRNTEHHWELPGMLLAWRFPMRPSILHTSIMLSAHAKRLASIIERLEAACRVLLLKHV